VKHQVPSGWIVTTIGEVTEDSIGQQRPAGPGDFTYIDIGAIDREAKRIAEPKRLPKADPPSRARQVVEGGDVLVSMTRPNLNAVALVPDHLDGATASTGFVVLRAWKIDPRWIYYSVQGSDFVTAMVSRVQGALYPAVRPDDVRSYVIPLAPAEEQKRIADSIDTSLSRLQSAADALARVRANLSRYRASVLKDACEGRLVPTEAELARREGRDYETAEALLERILKERRAAWEEQELAKYRAKGKEPKDERWKRKYKEPVGPNMSELPDLPEGWVWATVVQVGLLQSGQTPKRIDEHCRPEGEVPYFRVGDMNHPKNAVAMSAASNWLARSAAAELKLHIQPAGTVIFPKRGGAIATNKKRRLVRPSCYDLNTMGITPVGEIGEYFWWWFNGIDLSVLVDGSNVPQINHGDIEPLPIPVPPAAEQRRIATEVSKRCSLIEAVESTMSAAFHRTALLRQSILKSAFAGDLVPQDQNDEPASVLLERIQTERGSIGAPRGAGR
jgi:type I restriction enzyme, S subunit